MQIEFNANWDYAVMFVNLEQVQHVASTVRSRVARASISFAEAGAGARVIARNHLKSRSK
jgi:hypothetical protein